MAGPNSSVLSDPSSLVKSSSRFLARAIPPAIKPAPAATPAAAAGCIPLLSPPSLTFDAAVLALVLISRSFEATAFTPLMYNGAGTGCPRLGMITSAVPYSS